MPHTQAAFSLHDTSDLHGLFRGFFPSPTGHGCSFSLQLIDQTKLPHGKKPNLGKRLHHKLSGVKAFWGMTPSIATNKH